MLQVDDRATSSLFVDDICQYGAGSLAGRQWFYCCCCTRNIWGNLYRLSLLQAIESSFYTYQLLGNNSGYIWFKYFCYSELVAHDTQSRKEAEKKLYDNFPVRHNAIWLTTGPFVRWKISRKQQICTGIFATLICSLWLRITSKIKIALVHHSSWLSLPHVETPIFHARYQFAETNACW